ncbi:MAG: hypothetical protein K2I27_07735 [Bacteroides sp.]|nr:hypothetical protein [Bacteroides sp.]
MSSTPSFSMPMFHDFVPRKLQPWIYLCIAFTFQLSGGIYLGALNQMIGDCSLMREDLLMCMYSMLIGMSFYFPILFRTKFRFTNKTLLTASALVMLLCNLVVPYITCLPLLWAVCFVSGMAKIQGTFECMSNIQLWMTPKRDFTVFFPWLQMVILCSMQFSDLLTTYLMYYYHWSYMHLFVVGVMLVVLLFLFTCVKHFRFMKPFPLFGVDWLGWALWAALGREVTYLFCYADWLDWWSSPVFRQVAVVAVVNLVFCLWRMFTIRHPYLEPKMWTYRGLCPVLILITLIEAFLATEYVLEEVYYEEVMHYAEQVSVQLDWFVLVGIVCGCVFSYWWMHVRGWSYLRLCTIGLASLIAYLFGFYVTLSTDIHLYQLAFPVACRGFAYAALCSAFFVCLHELMSFQHFFQALAVFNLLHAVVGGVLGCAVYARGLSYFVPDNFSRYGASVERVGFSRAPFDLGGYMEEFISQMMEVSLKQLYGWVLYAAILLFLLFLLYDMPMRRQLKRMPTWASVKHGMMNSYWRVRHGKMP